MAIITLNEAKTYLRVDHDTDDELIQSFIDAAEALAVSHTGNADILTLDPMPEDLKQAVLAGVSYLYDHGTDPDNNIALVMEAWLASHRSWAF